MKNYKEAKMTFGKYKGRFIWEIPDVNYFNWLYNNKSKKLSGELLEAVEFKINKK